jgi:hypothetical protein
LTALPLSCADCLKIWEPQPPGTLRACQGLSWDCFAFIYACHVHKTAAWNLSKRKKCIWTFLVRHPRFVVYYAYLKLYVTWPSNTALYCIKRISKRYLMDNDNYIFRLSFFKPYSVCDILYISVYFVDIYFIQLNVRADLILLLTAHRNISV